eukprot:scaffold4194_cov131-Isochrysis_galbana.AAC.2
MASVARLVNRLRTLSPDQSRPVSRAWFSPSFKRCSRPCTPPVRLSSVSSVHVQPSIRQPAGRAPTVRLGPPAAHGPADAAQPHPPAGRRLVGHSMQQLLRHQGERPRPGPS